MGSGRASSELSRWGVHLLNGDDPDLVAAAIARHAVVCNLARVCDAPQTSLSYALGTPRRRLRKKLLRSIRAALAATPAVRLIQRSSAALYADGAEHWVAESGGLEPNAATAVAAQAEQVARQHLQLGGETVVLRFARPYGALDPTTERLFTLARRGWKPLEGRANAYIPTIHLDDAAAAVAHALASPCGTYNVGDDDPLTNAELNSLIGSAVGQHELKALRSSFRRADYELLERGCRLDARALQEHTGWRPCTAPSARSWFAGSRVPSPGARPS
jgi:nucleoside-diphosphate-sugar epimerase